MIWVLSICSRSCKPWQNKVKEKFGSSEFLNVPSDEFPYAKLLVNIR